MRFVELAHNTDNIGDDIQTLASSQFVGEISGVSSRDALDRYSGPPAAIIMSGWFSHRPQNWPPAPSLTPIFVGFHMSELAAQSYVQHRDYFKAFEPIGCRDERTTERFRSWGVEAYTSSCVTLTFPRRDRAPANDVVAVVDVPAPVPIPPVIRRRVIYVPHEIAPVIDRTTRVSYARNLLDFYRNEVALLVTGRLHAALPCLAMGIPVVFFGDPDSTRLSPLRDLGLPIHPPRAELALGEIDWRPPPLDVSAAAKKIADDVTDRVRRIEDKNEPG